MIRESAIYKALQPMEGLFTELPSWLAGQYDAKSGGFFYARSSCRLEGRVPDIESTAQALNMIARLELLDEVPTEVKERLVVFFQSKQHPESGYFYDDDPLMKEDEVMVARAIGYSRNALRLLGAAPLYPLPGTADQAPAYMESPESYLRWLESIELSNSWRGCDRLSCSHVYLKDLSVDVQKNYTDTALHFFERIQNEHTGLWGEGSLYVQISGTFKLHIFYNSFKVPMPRSAKIYTSILQALRHDSATDMCYIRNPIHLLSYLKPSMLKSELLFILLTTTANMSRLLRSDGGFSRELEHSPPAPNVAQVKPGDSYPNMPKAVFLSEGLVEGDMNAATQALLIRSLCYELAGLEAPRLNEQQRAAFLQALALASS